MDESLQTVLIKKVGLYFNFSVREWLNYINYFNVTVDNKNNSILLTSNINENQQNLIELLKNNLKLRIQIELSLLNVLKTKFSDILNVNIYIVTNTKILITYTFGDDPFQINDIWILARLVEK